MKSEGYASMNLSSAARVALIFALRTHPFSWVEVERLAPLLGGGTTGRRTAYEVVLSLEGEGLVETQSLTGKPMYRRTDAGVEVAESVLRDDNSELLVETASEQSHSVFEPEPGAPDSLDSLVGQKAAKHLISTNLAWAQRTGRLPASMLLYGPSGSGKTLIAGLVSAELGLPFIHLSVADLTDLELARALELAEEGAVVFLDEVHAGTKRLRDGLLVALDPGRCHPFVAMAATTDPGQLSPAFRRRFQLEIPLEEYAVGDVEELVRRRATALSLDFEAGLDFLIARAARANPARATRLVLEAAMLGEGLDEPISVAAFSGHLNRSNRDERGVDSSELEMLVFLRDQCRGPAGMRKFVDALGLDMRFIRERLHMLRREGLVQSRGTAGHALTSAGVDYLRRKDV